MAAEALIGQLLASLGAGRVRQAAQPEDDLQTRLLASMNQFVQNAPARPSAEAMGLANQFGVQSGADPLDRQAAGYAPVRPGMNRPAARPQGPMPATGTLSAYEPTTQERLNAGIADTLANLGVSRNMARDLATNVTGNNREMGALDFVPFVGSGIGLENAGRAFGQGRYLDAALEAAGGVVGAIPGGRAAARTVKADLGDGLRAAAERFTGSEFGGAKIPGAGGGKSPRKPKAPPAPPPTRMAQIPSIRGLDRDEAIKRARTQQHLIPRSGDLGANQGLYVGGPQTVKSYEDLVKMRKDLDKTIDRGITYADWYDRTRAAISKATGGNPKMADWFAKRGGMFSAGVSPDAELGFSIGDINSMVATGTPRKVARPAQQAASARAYAANDPNLFQLGKKTGEYANKINPNVKATGSAPADADSMMGHNQGPPIEDLAYVPHKKTATGVNDFRHARNLGYTEPDGTPRKGAMSDAEHGFMDNETALAVYRANKRKAGGRSDWTGEDIQAAPWVSQKADDLYSRGRKAYHATAKAELKAAGIANPTAAEIEAAGRQLALEDAGKTIGDAFDKHTITQTAETMPYGGANTLPNIKGIAPAAAKAFDDTLSGIGPDGRDLLLSAFRAKGTENAGLGVLPSEKGVGVWKPDDGPRETNPLTLAKLLGSFSTDPKTGKRVMEKSTQDIMDAVGTFKAATTAQAAVPYHAIYRDGSDISRSSVFVKAKKPLTPAETKRINDIGMKYGLPDAAGREGGLTLTDFYNGAPPMSPKAWKAMQQELLDTGLLQKPERVRVEGGRYRDFGPEWKAGANVPALTGGGRGAVSNKLLDAMASMPAELQRQMDEMPEVQTFVKNVIKGTKAAQKAGAGLPRADFLNMLEEIAKGPGWQKRLRKAVAAASAAAAAGVPVVGFAGEQDDRFVSKDRYGRPLPKPTR